MWNCQRFVKSAEGRGEKNCVKMGAEGKFALRGGSADCRECKEKEA